MSVIDLFTRKEIDTSTPNIEYLPAQKNGEISMEIAMNLLGKYYLLMMERNKKELLVREFVDDGITRLLIEPKEGCQILGVEDRQLIPEDPQEYIQLVVCNPQAAMLYSPHTTYIIHFFPIEYETRD